MLKCSSKFLNLFVIAKRADKSIKEADTLYLKNPVTYHVHIICNE